MRKLHEAQSKEIKRVLEWYIFLDQLNMMCFFREAFNKKLIQKVIIAKPRPKSQTPKAQPQPSQIQSKSVQKGLGLGHPTTPPTTHNF